MHHEIYNPTTEEQGVQKNIKIQYLKGGTKVYLKSRLYSSIMPSILLFVFIYCFWLILVFMHSYESGDLFWPHWLIDSWVPIFSSLKKSHVCMFIPHREKKKVWSIQRICYLPPWPPGAMVISIQVNITDSGFPIMFPHTASCCSRSQT